MSESVCEGDLYMSNMSGHNSRLEILQPARHRSFIMCLCACVRASVSDCFLIPRYSSQYIFCSGWVTGQGPLSWMVGVA